MAGEENIAPIRQSVRIDCPIEDAFQLFTEKFEEWWPLASHSISGDEAETCAMEPWVGGRLFERTRFGEDLEWGTVTAWEAPRRIEFTWHPAANPDEGQKVEVEFRVVAYGTEVTLTHYGWEACAPSATACATVTSHWGSILETYFRQFVSQILVTA